MASVVLSADAYLRAQEAAALLRRNPGDGEARGRYAMALRALGLHGAAERFRGDGAGLGGAAGVTGGTGGMGMIPWASRRRRFAANVQAAAARWPGMAGVEGWWADQAHDFELHQAGDGNYQVLKLSAGHMWQSWMGGLADHRGQAAGWSFDKRQVPIPPAMAFDGVGHGWFFLRIAEGTERSFLHYSCALYVLEPDPAALAILFHLHDLRGLLGHPRVRIFFGGDAMEELLQGLERNRTWSIPQQFVTCRITAGGTPQLQARCEGVIQQRQAERERLMAEVNARHAGRDLAWWRRRFEGTERLRVLCITTRYSTVLRYSMEELAAAIGAAGHEVEVAIEPDDHSLESLVVEKVHAFDPDLLVLLSRMRHENPMLPRGMPALCWDQDNLPCMRTTEATASLDGLTYVAGHAAIYGQYHLGWPARNCIPCFPAAAAHRYRPRALTAEEMGRYGCDFSYVSNASGSPEALREELGRAWQANPAPIFRRLADGLMARAAAGERFDYDGIQEIITSGAAAEGMALAAETRHELAIHLRLLADRCFRHAALEWVAGYCRRNGRTLKLYGTGWEAHRSLGAFSCGRVEPGEGLKAIILASKINLQIIETGIVHSRFLDGVAAGGFFLAREFMLPHERRTADAQYALATRAAVLGIVGGAVLLATEDAEIRRLWGEVGGPYGRASEDQLAAVLRLWRELPPHYVDLPHLDKITFDSEASLAALAGRYLEDGELRAKIAGELREQVLLKYAYDARWRQFLAGIQAGLRGR